MERPKIKIKLRLQDYITEIIAFIGLICLIAIPVFCFNILPDRLPDHFNALGQPDSYSGRGTIFFLPVTGLVLFVAMTLLNNYPWLFNYPVEITEENAERMYTIAQRTIRLLKLIIILSFAYINYKTIIIGLQRSDGLGTIYLPVFIILCFLVTGVMLIKTLKK